MSRATISGGSLAGPVRVVHELISKPGKVSAIDLSTLEVTGAAETLETDPATVRDVYRAAAALICLGRWIHRIPT